MRRDRCFTAWAHAACAADTGLDNLAILAGDASELLPDRFAEGSVARVFVNHPEPPQQSNFSHASDAAHMLTEDFLRAVQRVLRTKGTLAVTTDNLWYARLLRDTAAALGPEGEQLFAQPTIAAALEDERDGIALFRGAPPGCADATSYFDRLKTASGTL